VCLVERRLVLSEQIQVDVHALVEAADRVAGDTAPQPEDFEVLLGGATELLPGWYEDWVLIERERLRRLRLSALESLAEQECRRGRYGVAIDAALIAVGLEPLRERGHCTLIRAHLGERNTVEAVRHYHEYRALLRRELSVEPGTELTAMVADLGVTPR
jgi:DNA-binding SARP family transcriptional activator